MIFLNVLHIHIHCNEFGCMHVAIMFLPCTINALHPPLSSAYVTVIVNILSNVLANNFVNILANISEGLGHGLRTS